MGPNVAPKQVINTPCNPMQGTICKFIAFFIFARQRQKGGKTERQWKLGDSAEIADMSGVIQAPRYSNVQQTNVVSTAMRKATMSQPEDQSPNSVSTCFYNTLLICVFSNKFNEF